MKIHVKLLSKKLSNVIFLITQLNYVHLIFYPFLGGIYRILYEEVDEGDVKVFCFPFSQSDAGEVEEFRFPRAGCANSKSYLKMIEFKVNEHLQIVDICVLELQFSLSMLFPWMEYIVRMGWTPDGE